jgi:hypothetical protein
MFCLVFICRLIQKSMLPCASFLGSAPPQSGKRLAHCTDAVFHCARFDGVVAGGQTSVSVSFTKDLDHGDRIVPRGKLRVGMVGHAELFPSIPMLFHGFGTLCCNSGLDALVNKAEVSAQRICLRSGHSCQG